MSISEFMVLTNAKSAPPLIDVREPGQFHSRHIAGSINCPDSQTTALMKKVQSLEKALLVCNDGVQSSTVTRTLISCKITTVSYLEGGLTAWSAAGGKLFETTRSGFEHELPPAPKETAADKKKGGASTWIRKIKESLLGSDDEETD
jgi:rhodanese-related sulfurtransferase